MRISKISTEETSFPLAQFSEYPPEVIESKLDERNGRKGELDFLYFWTILFCMTFSIVYLSDMFYSVQCDRFWLSRPGSEKAGNIGLSSQTQGTVLLTVIIALKFPSKSEVSQIKEEIEGSPILKITTSIWLLLVLGGRQKSGDKRLPGWFCAFLEKNCQSSKRHCLCFLGSEKKAS